MSAMESTTSPVRTTPPLSNRSSRSISAICRSGSGSSVRAGRPLRRPHGAALSSGSASGGAAKEYGAQGPVTSTRTPGKPSAAPQHLGAEALGRAPRHEVGVVDDVLARPAGEFALLQAVLDPVDRVAAGSGLDALGDLFGLPVGVLTGVPLRSAVAQVGPPGAEVRSAGGAAGLVGRPRAPRHRS